MKTSVIIMFEYVFELVGDDTHVVSLNRSQDKKLIEHPEHDQWIQDLRNYELGHKVDFDWPILLSHTPFQTKVFNALMTIPFGETKTYHEVAQMINQPKAQRAVGQAISKNPVLIAIPCHRVLAKQGIGGFSSGLDLKKSLLNHEFEH